MPMHHHRPWTGQLTITTGAAYFRGAAGDNHAHRHWVDQYVFASTAFVLSTEDGQYTSKAAFIPSQQCHQLIATEHRSLFLDPDSKLSRAIKARIENFPSTQLTDSFARELCELLAPLDAIESIQSRHFETILHSLNKHFEVKSHLEQARNDARLEQILCMIHQQDIHERRILAQAIGLSESRFSHWFCEQTGIALRSYCKWHRLITAVEYIRRGSSIIEAAHSAGFTDQAHLNKSFIACFGIAPGQLRLSSNSPS